MSVFPSMAYSQFPGLEPAAKKFDTSNKCHQWSAVQCTWSAKYADHCSSLLG